MKNEKISKIFLNDAAIKRSAEIEEECKSSMEDLLENSYFSPNSIVGTGAYIVELSIIDRRLCFLITSEKNNSDSCEVKLSLIPFRSLIKDYFLICESYFEAVKLSNAYKIEAVDMGRRSIHNEASEKLMSFLDGKISMDLDTARRIFTLICVLHI